MAWRMDASGVTEEVWQGMALDERTRYMIVTRRRRGDYFDDAMTFAPGSSAASSDEGLVSPPEEGHASRPVGPGTTSSI